MTLQYITLHCISLDYSTVHGCVLVHIHTHTHAKMRTRTTIFSNAIHLHRVSALFAKLCVQKGGCVCVCVLRNPICCECEQLQAHRSVMKCFCVCVCAGIYENEHTSRVWSPGNSDSAALLENHKKNAAVHVVGLGWIRWNFAENSACHLIYPTGSTLSKQYLSQLISAQLQDDSIFGYIHCFNLAACNRTTGNSLL